MADVTSRCRTVREGLARKASPLRRKTSATLRGGRLTGPVGRCRRPAADGHGQAAMAEQLDAANISYQKLYGLS